MKSLLVAMSLFLYLPLPTYAQNPAATGRPTPTQMHLIQFFLNPEVQDDLELTAEQRGSISTLQERFNSRLREASIAVINARKTGEDDAIKATQLKLDELFDEADQSLEETLLPDQMRTLRSVFLRKIGVNAVLSAWVQEEISMTAEQEQKITELRETETTKLKSEIKKLVEADRKDEVKQLIIDRNKSIEKKMLRLLSDEQRARLSELEGSRFSLDP